MRFVYALFFKKKAVKGFSLSPKAAESRGLLKTNTAREGNSSKNVDLGRGGLVFSSDPFKSKEQKSLFLSRNPYSSAKSPSRDVIPSVTHAYCLQGAEHCPSENQSCGISHTVDD